MQRIGSHQGAAGGANLHADSRLVPMFWDPFDDLEETTQTLFGSDATSLWKVCGGFGRSFGNSTPRYRRILYSLAGFRHPMPGGIYRFHPVEALRHVDAGRSEDRTARNADGADGSVEPCLDLSWAKRRMVHRQPSIFDVSDPRTIYWSWLGENEQSDSHHLVRSWNLDLLGVGPQQIQLDWWDQSRWRSCHLAFNVCGTIFRLSTAFSLSSSGTYHWKLSSTLVEFLWVLWGLKCIGRRRDQIRWKSIWSEGCPSMPWWQG